MRIPYFLPILALSACASAAPIITTSVTCSNGLSLSDPAACNIPLSLNGTAYASVSASAGTSGNSLTSSLSGSSYAASGLLAASSSSSASLSDLLYTSGPIRPGILAVSSSGSANSFDGTALFDFLVDGDGAACNQGFCPPGFGSGKFAITLGESFLLTEMLSTVSGGTPEPTFSTASGGVTLQLFEADGVTPVDVFTAPEPSTWLLMLGAALLSFGWIRRARFTTSFPGRRSILVSWIESSL